ncbi:hypothetical protein JCM10296v2_005919 [Rhodotorula toruloides]
MSIQYEAPYYKAQIVDLDAAVRSIETVKVNNLELEMRRRHDLHSGAYLDEIAQDARERHDKIQRMAALASSEIQTLGSRKQDLIKQVEDYTREAGELEGRRKPLHRLLSERTQAKALADLLKAAHGKMNKGHVSNLSLQLGNLLGRERYLRITVDRLRSLAFIWKEAADGVVNLNAPPAYEEPPMSPSTPVEAGIYAEEYRLLESEVRRQSGLDNPHEPGDRNTHSELDELELPRHPRYSVLQLTENS